MLEYTKQKPTGVTMLCTGVDIIEVSRIEQAVAEWGSRFLNRIYTETEQSICKGRATRLASRFAGKRFQKYLEQNVLAANNSFHWAICKATDCSIWIRYRAMNAQNELQQFYYRQKSQNI